MKKAQLTKIESVKGRFSGVMLTKLQRNYDVQVKEKDKI